MDKKRIVITGIGVLASNGIGKGAFWQALREGRCGIKLITLFDVSQRKAKLAGEISGFNPEEIVGKKGLRRFDRATKLTICATHLALKDADYLIDSQIREENTALVLGTVFGNLESTFDFDTTALKEGPWYVNPALFPNTVLNSPASQAAIWHNLKGLNTTVSCGIPSGLNALIYAADSIKLGRAKSVLVCGVESLSPQAFLGLYKLGLLAGLKAGSLEICVPFDERHNGIIFGESAAVIIVEDLETALNRKAKIYAEIAGYKTGFDNSTKLHYNSGAFGLAQTMKDCLQASKLKPSDIGFVLANANSDVISDVTEARALKKVFIDNPQVPLSSLKALTAETFAASGILSLIAGIEILKSKTSLPSFGLVNSDKRSKGLNFVLDHKPINVENILVNASDPWGINASVVIKQYQ